MADEVIQVIKEFACANTSKNLLVLAVMCHGDEFDNMKFPEKEVNAGDLCLILDQEGKFSPEQVRSASFMAG